MTRSPELPDPGVDILGYLRAVEAAKDSYIATVPVPPCPEWCEVEGAHVWDDSDGKTEVSRVHTRTVFAEQKATVYLDQFEKAVDGELTSKPVSTTIFGEFIAEKPEDLRRFAGAIHAALSQWQGILADSELPDAG